MCRRTVRSRSSPAYRTPSSGCVDATVTFLISLRLHGRSWRVACVQRVIRCRESQPSAAMANWPASAAPWQARDPQCSAARLLLVRARMRAPELWEGMMTGCRCWPSCDWTRSCVGNVSTTNARLQTSRTLQNRHRPLLSARQPRNLQRRPGCRHPPHCMPKVLLALASHCLTNPA